MTIESVPIDSIHPDPANARRHSQRNLEAIKSSLARFGQQKPIVVDANNVVRAGNGTLAAAKALGWTHVGIVRSHLIGVEATAFAIADNRSAELAEWDPDVLSAALADPDIGDFGFSEVEAREYLREPEAVPIDDPQAPTSIGESFQVIVDCGSEERQQEVFERLSGEGLSCRLLTL
jgi:ParB-like chromosome segregation protein Spo0J